jgi:hypothetical protein
MKNRLLAFVLLQVLLLSNASAQFFPPGQFRIDGYQVNCGNVPTIVTTNIPDVAMNNGSAILINPIVIGGLPTVLKLFWYAHECAHSVLGPDEASADCWAIRTGRDQGWFPPQAFGLLMQMFQNNPGDNTHAPGPIRVQRMSWCYSN